jgi:hypothetical protein
MKECSYENHYYPTKNRSIVFNERRELPHPQRRASHSTLQHAVIRVYDEAGNVVERHGEAAGDFREFELRTTRA